MTPSLLDKKDPFFVAGHSGLVGSALTRCLQRAGFDNLLLRSSKELDLVDQSAVRAFFEAERPRYVVLAAAKVGGIHANNTFPAAFYYENAMIANNVIQSAWESGVKKLLFLGSSCIYPKMAPQPIPESALLTGPLEPTNEAYAIAKIAGLKFCQYLKREKGADFISAMPTNLYGPDDNFDLESSHVLPALLRKFHEAVRDGKPEVVVWGSGKPLREFLHADDLAAALLFLMEHYDGEEHVNVGSGEEVSIARLAALVAEATGFKGKIVHDPSRPDGTPRKLMDSSRLAAMGWRPSLSLKEGLRQVYAQVKDRLDRISA